MKEITSKENPIIKETVRLLSSKSLRRERGLFVTEGLRLCREAADAGVVIEQAFFTEDFTNRHTDEAALISSHAKQCCLISPHVSQKLSGTETPQGVFCVCKVLDNSCDVDTICGGKYILLSSLQDPGNIGTIIRTAEALGIDGIIMSEDCPDIFSPKVLRSTMGGVFRLPIKVTSSIEAEIFALRQKGTKVFAAALTDSAVSITDGSLGGSAAAVIGNEGSGLPQTVVDACDNAVIIPMARQGQSLNAACAACILIWELFKSK